MSWLSQGIHAIEDHLTGKSQRPDPTKFSDGTPVPTSSNSPYTVSAPPGLAGSGPLPGGGSSYSSTGGVSLGSDQYFTSDQKAQLQSSLSAAGVWDTIQGWGAEAWAKLSKLVADNGGWEKVAKDIGSFIKDDVVPAVSAYSDYQRQQQSDKYAQEGLNGSPDGSYEGLLKEYADKAPLRLAGQSGMLNPGANTPDLSKLGAAGSNGLTVKAPTALSIAPNTALQTIAGPGSGNPFAPKTLPMAPPTQSAPSIPQIPPQSFAPLPLAPSKPPGYNASGQPNGPATPTTPPGTPGTPATPGTPTPPGTLPLPPRLSLPHTFPALPLAPQPPNVGGPPPPRLRIQ